MDDYAFFHATNSGCINMTITQPADHLFQLAKMSRIQLKFGPECYQKGSRSIPGGGGGLPYESDGDARRLA